MRASQPPVLAWAAQNWSEIAIAAAIAAGIVALLYAARALALRACKRLGPQHPFAGVFLDVVRRTRLWFLVMVAVRLVEGYLHPPADVAKTIDFLFIIAAVLQVALWARQLILGLIALRTGDPDGQPGRLASAMGIIRLLVSVAVFAIAAVVILDNLGANVTGLVAGLGIGGIAIGLAAQGIFSDLFAALSILFDKPFRVGDTIVYQGKEGPVTGVVQQIGLKSTRVLALSGELRIIGNTQLLAQEVSNLAGRQLYRFHLVIGVVYHTDPEVLAEIPRLVEAQTRQAGHRFIRAQFKTFAPSSIEFDWLFEVDAGDPAHAHQGCQDAAFALLRVFRERGIAFAYPTQTTFTAAPDGTLVMPFAVPPANA